MSDTTGRGRRPKVARLLETYGFDDLGDELERRWTGAASERESLRDLADYVNRRLLAAAMADAGLHPIDGEVENTYRILTDDDASGGARVEARHRLERAGVDLDSLRDDFVSHAAVHTFLRNRGVEAPGADTDPIETAENTVSRLRGRTAAVTESTLERLRDADHLALEEFDVLVDVRVICENCGSDHTVGELLDEGGCDCLGGGDD